MGSAAPSVGAAAAASLEVVTRYHSPNVLFVDPAVDAAACDLAELRFACLEFGNNARLGEGNDLRRRQGIGANRGAAAADNDDGALGRQHAGIDPALGAFDIARSAPIFVRLQDL